MVERPVRKIGLESRGKSVSGYINALTMGWNGADRFSCHERRRICKTLGGQKENEN